MGPFLSASHDGPAQQRALGVSRSLAVAGAEVLIGAGDHGPADGLVRFPGVRVWSLGEVSRPADSHLHKGIERTAWGRRTVTWLDSLAPRPDAVIIYGGGAIFAHRVMQWARRERVPSVVDAVEWYDGTHQPMGRLGPISIDNAWAMHRVYRRSKHVICISSLLERHFASHGSITVRVPPTLDVHELPWRRDVPDERLTLAYAGTPGKKDLIDVVVRGIQRVDPEGARCRLHVLGMTEAEVRSLPACAEGLPSWLRAHGRVPRATALEVVGSSHYVPLVRPDKRYAHAGFPTKVVESLSSGTPVVCNVTSDLAHHVRDGVSGLVLSDSSAGAFAQGMTRAMAVEGTTYARMRAEARKEAERAFDFRVYVRPLSNFFDQVVRDRN